jgi:amino acid transporter
MARPQQPQLFRAIGRWSLAALTINCIIGSGVFGLPSVIYRALGNASPFAWIFAALAIALVMACFAEVSSRFDQSGGIYLYTRSAFGRTAGILVAWFGLLARLTAIGANANLFVIYLAEFWPSANSFFPRIPVLALLFGLLAWLNYIGVRSGTRLSNLFTALKLITLGAFVAGGLVFLAMGQHHFAIAAPSGPPTKWLHSILLLIFAYGGFETALTPGGEAKNPRHDYPFALFIALIVCAVVYTAVQFIVISVVPPSAMSNRPIADAVQRMIGPWGAGTVSIAILLATFGYLSANILGFPRILFALAEHGDAPPVMSRVHARFRTPHIAIVILAASAFIFSMAGSFEWNVTLSAVARLIYYGSVCAALPVLRHRKDAPSAMFRLPAGNIFAVLAVAVSLLLIPRLDKAGVVAILTVLLCVVVNSLWAARRERTKLAGVSTFGSL